MQPKMIGRPRYWEKTFGKASGPTIMLPEGIDPEIHERTDFLLNQIVNNVDRTTILDASNIAQWIDQNRSAGMINDGMMPPWPRTWVEWAWPEPKIGEGEGMAVWTESSPVEEVIFDNPTFLDGVSTVIEFIGPFWLIEGQSRGPFGSMQVRLNEAGAIIGERTITELDWARSIFFGEPGSDSWQRLFRWFSSTVDVALMSFQFANCRNVERIEVLPTRQQRRLAERKGEPVYKHYVLAIDANTQRKVYPKGQPIPSNRRLHICRGHFATYTEAAPLFGKLTGRFWVPAHVRGKAESGFIDKDYRVKAPTS